MIELINVSKDYENGTIIQDLNLTIQKGEIFALIGPSGSGKTSILMMTDHLVPPTRGNILIDGVGITKSMGDITKRRRNIGMVFQKPAMLNTTVYENVATGLRFRHREKTEIGQKVMESLSFVGLSDYSERKAVTLSGGEMQRVAIARALVTEPRVLLLDEPTANLDPVSTGIIEDLIVSINKARNATIVVATHDLGQGRRLADRIGLIIGGVLIQTGTADEIFSEPKTAEAARFVGVDNIMEGRVIDNNDGIARIDLLSFIVEAPTPLLENTLVSVCIRAEDIAIEKSKPIDTSVRNNWRGIIQQMLAEGPLIRIIADCGRKISVFVTRKSCEELSLTIGTEVWFSVKASSVHIIHKKKS